MMKKYNKPEIVTLALDMVDVIETSAENLAVDALKGAGVDTSKTEIIAQQITQMNEEWSW